jgi:hypothetical protein
VQPGDPAKTLAFANGLRKSVAASGRRWTAWPGGAQQLAAVSACIDDIQQRLAGGIRAGDPDAATATANAELRAVLEWTTYQSAAVATARALRVAQRTQAFAENLGLIAADTPSLASLAESEESLLENIATKNAYMLSIAERFPQLALPAPLVNPHALATPKRERKDPRLQLIQQLMKRGKKTPRG